jgi:hypothetical protein
MGNSHDDTCMHLCLQRSVRGAGQVFTWEPLHDESLVRWTTIQTDGRNFCRYCMMTAFSQTHRTPHLRISHVPFRKVKDHVLVEHAPVT